MRTKAQAGKVAALNGCVQLPGKPKPDGSIPLTRFVDTGPDFETHRSAVESVSVLFTLHHGHALPDGAPCRLAGKTRMDKVLRCPSTGELVDRDINAAKGTPQGERQT